jgi:hypothetical protein
LLLQRCAGNVCRFISKNTKPIEIWLANVFVCVLLFLKKRQSTLDIWFVNIFFGVELLHLNLSQGGTPNNWESRHCQEI